MATTPSGCIAESAVPAQSLAVVLSNLKKASEKLGRTEETRILGTLAASLELRARYGDGNADENKAIDPVELQNAVAEELSDLFPGLTERAETDENRGVLRALVWGKKVSSIQKSLLGRIAKSETPVVKEGDILAVCEACGFIYAGPKLPDICPVCKAPGFRFTRF